MSSAEPSAKVPATAAAPRFEWDFDVPDTPFWSDMELTVARNVIGCFRQEELDQMTFDGTLSVPDRLEYLLSQVEWKFAALEAEAAPEPLYAIDSKAWEDLLLAVATCQKFLNRPIDEEQTVAEVLGKTEGRKRLAWLGMMADLARRNGNHAASETAALEVLPVWRTHEKLGPDSPQALGMTRIIIESKWMQDGTKREEARLMLEETFTLRHLPRSLISGWDPNPFPNLSLSAAGLLVLADLHTIAQRTAITGGSSWLDAFVLAPGLHYQQAADALDRDGGGPGLFAQLGRTAEASPLDRLDDPHRIAINNKATLNYLKRLFRDQAGTDDVITLDVRSLVAAKKAGASLSRSMSDLMHRAMEDKQKDSTDVEWLSHALFLATPVLTTISITFCVLLEEWWALASIVALMLSRILNIWAIKQRSRPEPEGSSAVDGDDTGAKPAEYHIDLGTGRRVVLKGSEQDLRAVTTQSWMRTKTNFEGYLEAAAKLIVYLVAAFSGNLSQVGSIILMALLLSSAGCLGLSNGRASGFKMHGRVARPEKKPQPVGGPGGGGAGMPVIDGRQAIRLSEDKSRRASASHNTVSRDTTQRSSMHGIPREVRKQMYMDGSKADDDMP